MGWKSVALAGCLLPVLAGCGVAHRAAENLTADTRLAHAQRGIEHDLRAEAHAAWATVCGHHVRRTFTAEFRDGFLDGYVDYLDRGGCAQPPAVPPIKYVRSKKYFTPEGHCLIQDYYLGFKYGADVAVASGRRQYLTVPVLLPDGSCLPGGAVADPGVPAIPYIPAPPRKPGSDELPPPRPLPPEKNKFGDPKKKSDDPIPVPPEPLPTSPGPDPGENRSIPPLPKPALPVIRPFNPDLSGADKFAPIPVPPDADLLPVPNPPLPTPGAFPLPVPPEETRGSVPSVLDPLPTRVPSLKVSLPAALDAAPPAGGRTPLVLGEVPVIPFRYAPPAGAGPSLPK